MKELVMDRLNRMEDLEQRKLLKNMMTGLFLNLVEYQEEMSRELQDRVFSEVEDHEERHDIYASLCSREGVDPIHEFLFPMLPEDMEPLEYDLRELAERMQSKEETVLSTVFLECGYNLLRTLDNGVRHFQGGLVTSGGTYPIQVRLRKSRRYTDEIERLYEVFQQNGIAWKTINHPYLHKFYEVILVSCEHQPEAEEEVKEISVHLEEFEPYKRLDLVPLWNIERLLLRNAGFPIPAEDRVNFEHVLSLRKTGEEHGYLVNAKDAPIRYIKRMPADLVVVSPDDKSGDWEVMKLTRPKEGLVTMTEYELVSNRRQSSFIGRYAGKRVVRAKGELLRIANSFEVASKLELESIELLNAGGKRETAATYSLNAFVSDSIRTDLDKKTLLLRFRKRDTAAESFILQDLMSFVVSELQMHFPEYNCEGEWA
ncbi:hypothetical protein [Paenibacillus pinihumi]|uniref:hypothetical protein n=1 Tax=Paenibacillus pinihumi TaxID=669462 RepID=UPI00048AC983|nr:hypothetical protein [Paenibacillus pinihumi]